MSSTVTILLCLVDIGLEDPMDMGNLVIKASLFFNLAISSWNLPHIEHTRSLACVYEPGLTSKHTYSF